MAENSKLIPLSVTAIIITISTLIYLTNRETTQPTREEAAEVVSEELDTPVSTITPTVPTGLLVDQQNAAVKEQRVDSQPTEPPSQSLLNSPVPNEQELYVDESLLLSESSEQWRSLIGVALQQFAISRGMDEIDPDVSDRIINGITMMVNQTVAMGLSAAENQDPLPEDLSQLSVFAELEQLFQQELGVGVYEFMETLNPDNIDDVDQSYD